MATTIDRYKLIVDTGGAKAGVSGFASSIKGLGPLIAAAFTVKAVLDFGNAMKAATGQFENYRNQIKLITNSQAELTDTMQKLNNAAVANRSSFGDTVDLYSKLTLATEELGVSQDQVLKATGNFQKALAISGADAGTAAGAIRQFGQAMASGTVRGDEFNSIVEALGPALIIMARESGITVGELRKMSQAGELTAEAFFKMIEGSKAIEAAFASTAKTIAQLETELGDATGKMLATFAEWSGIADGYRGTLENLARTMRSLGNAATDLEKANFGDLVNNESLGTASERLKEFNRDAGNLSNVLKELKAVELGESFDLFGIRMATLGGESVRLAKQLGLTVEQFKEYKAALEAAVQAEGLAAESAKAELEALQEKAKVSAAALKPYKELLASTDEMAKANERGKSAMEKASEAQAKSAEALSKLQALTGTYAAEFIPDLNDKIAIAKTRHEQLTAEVKKLGEAINKTATSQGFYDNLIKESELTVASVGFAKDAVARLTEAFAAGKITLAVYEEAMKRLNNTLDVAKDKSEELAAFMKENAVSAQERLNASLSDIDLQGLEGVKRTVKEIEIEELKLMRTAQERAKAQFGDADAQKLKAALAEIEATSNRTMTARQNAAKQLDAQVQAETKAARTFSAGWKRAFDDYADNATNASKTAEKIFAKTTSGMEDMIVGFAKTGKFEWKSFVSSLLEDLLRAQIQKTMASVFQMPGLGGGGGTIGSQAGGLFGGFFATGGMIPPGRFGVVGENGPELVSGPANVTPNLGGGNVTYNIQAVDARSFKELVAADPGFIHAVATKGGNSVPRRR